MTSIFNLSQASFLFVHLRDLILSRVTYLSQIDPSTSLLGDKVN